MSLQDELYFCILTINNPKKKKAIPLTVASKRIKYCMVTNIK